MTKHKSAEERKEEIKQAAIELIDKNGYSSLTMDAIVANTSLSKGGVYRFYSNKREVALDIFNDVYKDYYSLTTEEVLGWDLPLIESILRIILFYHTDEYLEIRNHRIWLQMIPEAIHDIAFRDAKRDHSIAVQNKMMEFVSSILKRDGMKFTKNTEAKIRVALGAGNMLVEGLIIEKLCGISEEDAEEKVKFYLEMILKDGIEKDTQ